MEDPCRFESYYQQAKLYFDLRPFSFCEFSTFQRSNSFASRGNDGIGRRSGLKIRWHQCRVGSSPISRIGFIKSLFPPVDGSPERRTRGYSITASTSDFQSEYEGSIPFIRLDLCGNRKFLCESVDKKQFPVGRGNLPSVV